MSKKEEICANKIFNGLVEGRISKQLKEVCLLDQTYVMAADGKQTVKAYIMQKFQKKLVLQLHLRASSDLKQAKVSKRKKKILQLK